MMELPKDFTDYTLFLMGEERYGRFLCSLDEQPPTAIRLNPDKHRCGDVTVVGAGGEAPVVDADGQVPWCPQGWYLRSRPNFTFDPLLHAGVYYVQEASSMFVDNVLRQYVAGPVQMLDLCAAPGGKSTAARAVLPEGSLLFSNEPIPLRAQILSENLQKWGHPDVVVTNNYPKDYRKAGISFDVILADVPCSGEGMFRKDPNAIAEWSRRNVFGCAQLQRDIVSDAWHCLRPGGILVYSTCTYNAQEDEENVRWIATELGAELLPVAIDAAWQVTGSLQGEITVYRFIPGYTRGEGLFMAVLRKTGDGAITPKDKGKNKERKGTKVAVAESDWVRRDQPMAFLREDDAYRAIPARWLPVYQQARKALRVLHAGIKLGTFKGKDVLPDQSLALSTLLNKEAFPAVSVTYEQAIAYLRKEAVVLPAEAPRGFVLLTYRDKPLGFVKNIGNRANNLYPQEWKIKSSHVPDTAPNILSHP